MSSAKKHKQRSHRSYRNNIATAEHFQNRQILKVSQQKVMKEETAMDYLMFQNGVDTKKFGEKLLNTVMYSSSVSSDDVSVTVNMQKDGDNDGKN